MPWLALQNLLQPGIEQIGLRRLLVMWQRLPLAVPVAEADVREANRGSIPSSTVPAVSRCARLMRLARTCMARHSVAARRPRSAWRARRYRRAERARARARFAPYRKRTSLNRSPRAHTCQNFSDSTNTELVEIARYALAWQRRICQLVVMQTDCLQIDIQSRTIVPCILCFV